MLDSPSLVTAILVARPGGGRCRITMSCFLCKGTLEDVNTTFMVDIKVDSYTGQMYPEYRVPPKKGDFGMMYFVSPDIEQVASNSYSPGSSSR